MRQFLSSCALVAFAADAASCHARAASQVIAQPQAVAPGPLERRAKPITPQNPVPRLSLVVMPQQTPRIYPAFIVDLRAILDKRGRIGEVRPQGQGRETRGFYVSKPMGGEAVGFAPLVDIQLIPRQDVRPTITVSRGADAFEAFVKATMDAVRKWRYEPPVDGPIALDVSFAFVGTDVWLLSYGVPVVAGRSQERPLRGAPPPSRPRGTLDWTHGAVRPGGGVTEPRKVKEVALEYPPIAISARVGGDVVVEARVDLDGRVREARVIQGNPMLNAAAVDAVTQWEFTPTLVDATPVPVLVTLTLTFRATYSERYQGSPP